MFAVHRHISSEFDLVEGGLLYLDNFLAFLFLIFLIPIALFFSTFLNVSFCSIVLSGLLVSLCHKVKCFEFVSQCFDTKFVPQCFDSTSFHKTL